MSDHYHNQMYKTLSGVKPVQYLPSLLCFFPRQPELASLVRECGETIAYITVISETRVLNFTENQLPISKQNLTSGFQSLLPVERSKESLCKYLRHPSFHSSRGRRGCQIGSHSMQPLSEDTSQCFVWLVLLFLEWAGYPVQAQRASIYRGKELTCYS